MNLLRRQKLLPEYSLLPLIFSVVLHFSVYLGTQLIVDPSKRRVLSCTIDELIPVVPDWTLIYVATFFFWAAGLLIISRAEKSSCYEQYGVLFVSEIISLIFFLAIPTTMPRPVLDDLSYSGRFLAIIYQVDKPVNLFPSMHCLLAWLSFRAAVKSPETEKPFKLFFFVFAVLICISTVAVKQHLFWDAVSGVAFAELAIVISQKLHAERIFYALEHLTSKISRRDP